MINWSEIMMSWSAMVINEFVLETVLRVRPKTQFSLQMPRRIVNEQRGHNQVEIDLGIQRKSNPIHRAKKFTVLSLKNLLSSSF